jgi:hypothetical protein
LALTLSWSALALGAAAFALKRLWREQETEDGTLGWRKRWREFVHGGRESRQRLRRSWLDVNPFVWLAGRDRQPATLGWMVVIGIVLVWLLCWAAWPAEWLSVPNFFITTTLLNFVLAWLTRHTAAQEIGLARRDGFYELLLTTPLDPSDIVSGVLDSLRWHFRSLTNFVLSLEVLMMLGGLLTRAWNTRALVVYLCTWLFLLTWIWSLGHRWSRVLLAMWVSLNCGRPVYAIWRATAFGSKSRFWWVMWIWFLDERVINFQLRGWGFQQFPTGSRSEVYLALFFLLIWLGWLAMRCFSDRGNVEDFKWNPTAMVWLLTRPWAKGESLDRKFETRLINEFREIVREPLPDPSDPRFKKWDLRERFP